MERNSQTVTLWGRPQLVLAAVPMVERALARLKSHPEIHVYGRYVQHWPESFASCDDMYEAATATTWQRQKDDPASMLTISLIQSELCDRDEEYLFLLPVWLLATAVPESPMHCYAANLEYPPKIAESLVRNSYKVANLANERRGEIGEETLTLSMFLSNLLLNHLPLGGSVWRLRKQ